MVRGFGRMVWLTLILHATHLGWAAVWRCWNFVVGWWRRAVHLDLVKPRTTFISRGLLLCADVRALVFPLSQAFGRDAWRTLVSLALCGISSVLSRRWSRCSAGDVRRAVGVMLIRLARKLAARRRRRIVDERSNLRWRAGQARVRWDWPGSRRTGHAI